MIYSYNFTQGYPFKSFQLWEATLIVQFWKTHKVIPHTFLP